MFWVSFILPSVLLIFLYLCSVWTTETYDFGIKFADGFVVIHEFPPKWHRYAAGFVIQTFVWGVK
jgi:hypothetical protein